MCDKCGGELFESLPLWVKAGDKKEGYLKCKDCDNYVKTGLVEEDENARQ